MVPEELNSRTVCIIGLGYVGMPLAEAFSKHIRVIGYDIDEKRFKNPENPSGIIYTTDPAMIKQADYVIICVPTPINDTKEPDVSYIESAALTIGQNLKKNSIIVLESTVYPGVVEEIVAPVIEKESGLRCGEDFKVGYSPERINPGDPEHTIDKITKVVAGMDEPTTAELAALYGLVTNVYTVSDIKTAEAAKVIENIQRDLNIALINELSILFNKIGIDTREVLDAAGTKWNFHKYRPGMIGGHCIPVDPYYLVYKARKMGYHTQVILAGRAINDYMPKYVAELAIKGLNEQGKVIKGSKILVMGLTYKEDVPDVRESPTKKMIKELKEYKADIYGHDPLLTEHEIMDFDVKPHTDLDAGQRFDCVIITVKHKQFRQMTINELKRLMDTSSTLIDVRGFLDKRELENEGIHYKRI